MVAVSNFSSSVGLTLFNSNCLRRACALRKNKVTNHDHWAKTAVIFVSKMGKQLGCFIRWVYWLAVSICRECPMSSTSSYQLILNISSNNHFKTILIPTYSTMLELIHFLYDMPTHSTNHFGRQQHCHSFLRFTKATIQNIAQLQHHMRLQVIFTDIKIIL